MKHLLLVIGMIAGIGFSSQADVCTTPTSTVSGTDNANVTATVTNFTCVGANPIVGATLNASIGANCTSWYYYSIVVNGVTVATTQCNQTGFDLTPYLPLTSVSIVSFDNPADGIGDAVTMVATVNLTYFPPCSSPTGLSATGITSSSANLNWGTVAGASTYTVEWGVPGFTPGIGAQLGTVVGTTNTTEMATGLTPLTNYQFYVISDCGVNGMSVWAGPFAFSTPCAEFMWPWTDNIEAIPAVTGTWTTSQCWTQPTPSSTSLYDWNVTGTGTTPSNPTGALSAHSGTRYFYTEGSYGTNGVSTTTLVSPLVDVTGMSTMPMVEFWYHMFGTQIGSLATQVWDGSTWNQVDIMTGQQQATQASPWLKKSIYLPGYTGVIQVRFVSVSGGTFLNDICIDDVSIIEAPTCPEPNAFAVTGGTNSTVDLDWNPIGSEVEWQLEYGAVGFVPETGAGTTMLTLNDPETIPGLAPNQFYNVYLQAVCSPGDTSALVGPITFNTYDQGMYMDWDTDCPVAGFIDISTTGQDLLLTDDSEAGIAVLPFPILFQGILYTNMTVGNNGGLQLGTTTGAIGYGGVFTTMANGTMFAWGDDLDDETGNVYIEQIGVSPNSVLVIQWDEINNFAGALGDPTVTFQIQIDEATGEIFYVYDDVVFGGTDAIDDYGAAADIGISGPNQDITVSTNNANYLMNNSCAHFFYTDCPNPINFTVVYTTNDEAGLSWSAGLSGETDWTVIYGPQGFDPLVTGTTITTSSPVAIIPGLTDITTYDVYIYADCNPGVLQSSGVTGQFTTLPNCSDVTGVGTATAIDSVFTNWSWTESSGIGTYAATGFNLQYGFTGFSLYDGNETIVNADNNLSDTTENTSFVSGGVYQMYVQAVCGVDTSNWVGPMTFTMPLTNDPACSPEDLMVDGTVYVMSNAGATVEVNESTIAPPATGYQTSDGWGNSNVNFTTWFTFTAPASGNVAITGMDVNFDGQIAIYDATDCADFTTFTLLAANDDALSGGGLAPEFSVCGLTPGNSYYLMHDSWSTSVTGVYSITLEPIVVEAGSSTGLIDACTGDVVDLFDGMNGYDMGGSWSEEIPTAGFADPLFATAGLAYQVFTFEYEVTNGCARDTAEQQVQIYGPSSAGVDGSMTVCQNEPVNLLAGLSGNVDLGGTWYDPSNNQLPSGAITASFIPGSFNYDYITGNGVCPNDTSNVVVIVSPACDYLNIQEELFGTMDVYPNPTTGIVYVANTGSTEVFNFEITDVNGKVIVAKEAAINGTETTEINLTDINPGVYMIQVFNDNATTTYRIIKQ